MLAAASLFAVAVPRAAGQTGGDIFAWNVSYVDGSTVQLDVILRGSPERQATGAQVYLDFDPSHLQVVDADAGAVGVQIQPGPVFPGTWSVIPLNNVDNATGRIGFVGLWGLGEPTMISPFVLASVTFLGGQRPAGRLTDPGVCNAAKGDLCLGPHPRDRTVEHPFVGSDHRRPGPTCHHSHADGSADGDRATFADARAFTNPCGHS